ncbi:hypothetical protein CAPTEDRAFT_199807 [Capitella teleta]|uniref:Uncharacterized protein n=1 Tax=Capitella teleta TaxID=283909 RepID=R7V7B8_CAPTE|nr:hypothetical protein CAPTEDRAFT_199807 [Capitella teleta]|eukprot:ELU12266.1 hypothetical protein CAPTEDRAFT_199807 [Capitella teleta]
MYMRPHLEYASLAWAVLTATQTGLLESLQHRAMWIILTLPHTHHITDADYAALNITSLGHRRNFVIACYMFKLYSNRLLCKLSKYKPVPHTNPYNMRNCVLCASYVTHNNVQERNERDDKVVSGEASGPEPTKKVLAGKRDGMCEH